MAEADRSVAQGEVFNLGNTEEVTIRELADVVVDVVDSESSVVFEDLPVDDPEVRQPDISKATETFGWEPSVRLREGLARTVEVFDVGK